MKKQKKNGVKRKTDSTSHKVKSSLQQSVQSQQTEVLSTQVSSIQVPQILQSQELQVQQLQQVVQEQDNQNNQTIHIEELRVGVRPHHKRVYIAAGLFLLLLFSFLLFNSFSKEGKDISGKAVEFESSAGLYTKSGDVKQIDVIDCMGTSDLDDKSVVRLQKIVYQKTDGTKETVTSKCNNDNIQLTYYYCGAKKGDIYTQLNAIQLKCTNGCKNGVCLQALKLADGKSCKVNTDCTSNFCTANTKRCAPKIDCTKVEDILYCENNILKSKKAEPECGLPKVIKKCSTAETCEDNKCVEKIAAVSCSDGIKNQDETDVDCGGLQCSAIKCALNKKCSLLSDCDTSLECTAGVCVEKQPKQPTAAEIMQAECTAKKDQEVANSNKCNTNLVFVNKYNGIVANGKCAVDKFKKEVCTGDCKDGACVEKIAAVSCSDGIKNQDETDVDCGGLKCSAIKCALNKKCSLLSDCDTSLECTESVCVEKQLKQPTAAEIKQAECTAKKDQEIPECNDNKVIISKYTGVVAVNGECAVQKSQKEVCAGDCKDGACVEGQITFTDKKLETAIKEYLKNEDYFKSDKNKPITKDYAKTVKKLELKGKGITSMVDLQYFTSLEYLDLGVNQLSKIEDLDTLTKLQTLALYNNQIKTIQGLDTLTNLKMLLLSNNQISKIEGLNQLINLQMLTLSDNQIIKIEGLDTLIKLQWLSLGGNKLSKIEGLDKLSSLGDLYLNSNKISEIKDLDKLISLKKLVLSNNQIPEIKGLDTLTNLITLSLLGNSQLSEVCKKNIENNKEAVQALIKECSKDMLGSAGSNLCVDSDNTYLPNALAPNIVFNKDSYKTKSSAEVNGKKTVDECAIGNTQGSAFLKEAYCHDANTVLTTMTDCSSNDIYGQGYSCNEGVCVQCKDVKVIGTVCKYNNLVMQETQTDYCGIKEVNIQNCEQEGKICKDGVCVEKSVDKPVKNILCIDTDAADNPFISGKVTSYVNGDSEKIDSCNTIDGISSVIKYSCNSFGAVKTLQPIMCENGCDLTTKACKKITLKNSDLPSPNDIPAGTDSVTCGDSDKGEDFTVKGYVVLDNGDGDQFDDTCSDGIAKQLIGDYVLEYTCDVNKAKEVLHKCEFGCEQGICIKFAPKNSIQELCEDSDGGDFEKEFGKVTISGKDTLDSCTADKTKAIEQSCTNVGLLETKEIVCQKGFICNGGKCVLKIVGTDGKDENAGDCPVQNSMTDKQLLCIDQVVNSLKDTNPALLNKIDTDCNLEKVKETNPLLNSCTDTEVISNSYTTCILPKITDETIKVQFTKCLDNNKVCVDTNPENILFKSGTVIDIEGEQYYDTCTSGKITAYSCDETGHAKQLPEQQCPAGCFPEGAEAGTLMYCKKPAEQLPPPPPSSDSCVVTEDCDEGFSCIDGVCVEDETEKDEKSTDEIPPGGFPTDKLLCKDTDAADTTTIKGEVYITDTEGVSTKVGEDNCQGLQIIETTCSEAGLFVSLSAKDCSLNAVCESGVCIADTDNGEDDVDDIKNDLDQGGECSHTIPCTDTAKECQQIDGIGVCVAKTLPPTVCEPECIGGKVCQNLQCVCPAGSQFNDQTQECEVIPVECTLDDDCALGKVCQKEIGMDSGLCVCGKSEKEGGYCGDKNTFYEKTLNELTCSYDSSAIKQCAENELCIAPVGIGSCIPISIACVGTVLTTTNTDSGEEVAAITCPQTCVQNTCSCAEGFVYNAIKNTCDAVEIPNKPTSGIAYLDLNKNDINGNNYLTVNITDPDGVLSVQVFDSNNIEEHKEVCNNEKECLIPSAAIVFLEKEIVLKKEVCSLTSCTDNKITVKVTDSKGIISLITLNQKNKFYFESKDWSIDETQFSDYDSLKIQLCGCPKPVAPATDGTGTGNNQGGGGGGGGSSSSCSAQYDDVFCQAELEKQSCLVGIKTYYCPSTNSCIKDKKIEKVCSALFVPPFINKCFNKQQDEDELGVDCGGTACNACPPIEQFIVEGLAPAKTYDSDNFVGGGLELSGEDNYDALTSDSISEEIVQQEEEKPKKNSNMWYLLILVFVIVVIVGLIMFKRRQHSDMQQSIGQQGLQQQVQQPIEQQSPLQKVSQQSQPMQPLVAPPRIAVQMGQQPVMQTVQRPMEVQQQQVLQQPLQQQMKPIVQQQQAQPIQVQQVQQQMQQQSAQQMQQVQQFQLSAVEQARFDKLKQYAQMELQKGFTKEQVKEKLMGVGWKEDLIEHIIENMN